MIVKRSVSIRGHPTSVSIEDAFWVELRSIGARRGRSIAELIADIDAERGAGRNLSSAIRVFVLRDALDRAVAVAELGSDQKSVGGATPGSPS